MRFQEEVCSASPHSAIGRGRPVGRLNGAPRRVGLLTVFVGLGRVRLPTPLRKGGRDQKGCFAWVLLCLCVILEGV